MKKIVSVLFLLACYHVIHAQDDECLERILAKNGGWQKGSVTNRASQIDFAVQKKFTDVAYSMLSAYTPRGVQALWDGSHMSVMYKQPVATYRYTLRAMTYLCSGQELKLNHETNTKLTISFNSDFGRLLFDTTTDEYGAGFNVLREGFPEEIQPGVWLFKNIRTSLGFGNEGLTNYWLITYPGQLPWLYVTRREFLIKRKQTLKRLLAMEEPRYKEQIQKWELQKKYLEQEAKKDPVKFERFMNMDYKPGIEREKTNFENSKKQFETAIEKVDQQLQDASSELNKPAITIKSTSNHLDYSFTEKMERFAEILVKPNPGYFKKGLGPSVPQLIEVANQYFQKDSVSCMFARDIEKYLNLSYWQSCIGKTTPPPFGRNSSVQSGTNAKPTANPLSSSSTNNNSARSTNSSTSKTTQQKTISQTSSGKNVFLSGTLSAPAGVPVTLAYNGGNDLTITPAKGAGALYSTSPVRFSKSLKEDEAYNVVLKKIASNMRGVVYSGKGKAPVDVDNVKVGVDFTYELLTRSSDDKVKSSFFESFAPAVGGYAGEEGRYVVFISATKGFEGSNGKFRQVFWRDRNTGVTKMISVAAASEQGNGDCGEPSISADGQTVVFESKATNLVTGDNNNVKDIFLWRKSTNSIELISKATNGGAADAESFDASISGDGNFVVFTSPATNLATVPKGRSLANIFLRDIQKGKTEMISVDPLVKTGGNGYKGSISFDGSRISFCSPSGTLVANDKNNLWDIFLWQRDQAGLKRISMTHDGKEKNAGTESASRQVASVISGNGRFVAFATTASNMVPNDNNNFQDVFVVDVETGKVKVASFTDDGQPSNNDSPIEQGDRVAISYDGTWIAFPTKATNLGAAASNIILHNTVSGKKSAASNVTGSYVGRPSISYSGSYVIFGKSVSLDNRFSDSGIFAHFTGNGLCRDCK